MACKDFRAAFLIGLLCFVSAVPAGAVQKLPFTFHRNEAGPGGPTLLVVGGIQGDEPGGFQAAALLVTHYRVRWGNVWVVPNLNFLSIIERSRGVYGDLNRKFKGVDRSDPEYETVERIKKIILDPQVDVVLNLHDGSGFYRPRYEDRHHNPWRWGQSVIIDQSSVDAEGFGDLVDTATAITTSVNARIPREEYTFSVKNTRTRDGDLEMEKTLTYFAVRNEKPAFGLEVSKSFSSAERTYYHLLLLEAFMDRMGIAYERLFPLSVAGVETAVNDQVTLAFYDNRIVLDVADVRGRLRYVPLKKDAPIQVSATSPLLAVVQKKSEYFVYNGNRLLTKIHPQYFVHDASLKEIGVRIDGEERRIPIGGTITVADQFEITPRAGYRVNVIGFKKPGVRNESGIAIRRSQIRKRFSVDRKGRVFRVEVYRGPRFTGMVLVRFDGPRGDVVADIDSPGTEAASARLAQVKNDGGSGRLGRAWEGR